MLLDLEFQVDSIRDYNAYSGYKNKNPKKVCLTFVHFRMKESISLEREVAYATSLTSASIF